LSSEASDGAGEEDDEGENTKSEDEDQQVNEDNVPGETITPEEPETRNPKLVDDANSMKVAMAPPPPTAGVAASSIMAGNTVIESPSPHLPPLALSSPGQGLKNKRTASPGKAAPDTSVPPEGANTVSDREECDNKLEEAGMQPTHCTGHVGHH
jgi:hypothetical protein